MALDTSSFVNSPRKPPVANRATSAASPILLHANVDIPGPLSVNNSWKSGVGEQTLSHPALEFPPPPSPTGRFSALVGLVALDSRPMGHSGHRLHQLCGHSPSAVVDLNGHRDVSNS